MATLRGAGFISAVCFASVSGVLAQPTVNHIYPAAGQQGTTGTVTAIGKFDSWPPQVWIDAPGITFTPATNRGNFEVTIARDAAPGPHFVRFIDSKGSSAPRFFTVSREPELRELETNDEFSRPQRIEKLPATVSGRLDRSGDVDSFAVRLKRGQPLRAWLEAYVLMSPFDGLLRIVDTNGTQLAFNHDGRTLDPVLTWEAPHDGTFIVQVMGFVYPATAAVGLTGSDACVYRLHLDSGRAANSFPACRLPEVRENEPNDTADHAQSVTVPAAVTAAIQRSGDEDRFAFSAEKQKTYELKIIAARAGSPLDAWLRVENAAGKELARNDDADGSRDPRLAWTAPSNGVFIAAVGDVTHRGGNGHVYRLEIAETLPAVSATVANHFFSVQPGKTSEVKVTLKRLNGFKAKLQLVAKHLPDEVTSSGGAINEKATEGTLKLTAQADSKPANQPFQIVLRETESGREHAVWHFLTTSGENNGVPQGYSELVIDSIDQLWLTVSAEPPKPPKKKKK